MPFELTRCDEVLLRAISDRRVKRWDVALTYRMAIFSSWPTNWEKVNEAIIARWSRSGLEWIKQKAWRGVP